MEGWQRAHQTLYRWWNCRGRIGRPKKDCKRQGETCCYSKSYTIISRQFVSHLFWEVNPRISFALVLHDDKELINKQSTPNSLTVLKHAFCCKMLPGVFAVPAYPFASRCPQFGVLYLGVLQDWGVPGHKMFPVWRILCRPRHFVARGDVFMAANPSAASPRNLGDTLH